MMMIVAAAVVVSCAAFVQAEQIVLVAGGGEGGSGSPAKEAKLVVPFSVGFDAAGNTYILEFDGNRLHRVDPGPRNVLTTIAGDGQKGREGDGGPAKAARFDGPHNIVVTPDGTIYVADTWNNTVRRIDPRNGMIATIAGTGEKGFGGDGGPAAQAKFAGTFCIDLDHTGRNLYVTDLGNRRIRRIDLSSGIVTTVAGNGEKGVPVDGAMATESPLVDPRAAAIDSKGNLYILERGGHALRVVDPQGRIRTVAGTGKKGSGPPEGSALSVTLNGPKHLCIDGEDNVIIADAENHRILKYVPGEGRVVHIAGSGAKGSDGLGGDPRKCQLARPHGVTIAPDGTLYIADSYNDRVVKIED